MNLTTSGQTGQTRPDGAFETCRLNSNSRMQLLIKLFESIKF